MDNWDRVRAYSHQKGLSLFQNAELTPKQARRYEKKYWRDQKAHERMLAELRDKAEAGATAEDLKLAEWELELIMSSPKELD